MELVGRVKYITANTCTILLSLYILITNFSLVGLVVFCISSLLLFAGTLLDRKTFDLGISCKVDFYIFISMISAFGTFLPVVFENKRHGSIAIEFSVLGVLALVAALILFACSAGVRSVYRGIVLKYIALFALVYGVNELLGVNFEYVLPSYIIILFFFLIDIYVNKTQAYYYQSWNYEKSKKTVWMALLICAMFLFVNIYMGTNAYRLIYSELAIKEIFGNIFSLLNVVMFTLLMLVSASVYLYQDLGHEPISLKDSYTSLSAGEIFILLTIYYNFAKTETLIMLLLSVIILIVFGFSMIRMNPSNPAAVLMGKFSYAPLLISVIVTVCFAFSIIFVFNEYLVPWIVLVAGFILVLVSRKIFDGFWIAGTMRWQMILIAITMFLFSVAFINQTLGSSLVLILAAFFISSLLMWAFGIRDGIWDNKYIVSKVFGCVMLGGIGLFAVM